MIPAVLHITMEEAVEAAGVPAEEWGGKCHQISSALAERVGGKVHRGYAPGIKCHPESYWANGMAQHSWIALPDGTVVDPTRFTTEAPGTEPYIWVGPDDDYDAGGSRLQANRVGPPPDTLDTGRELIYFRVGSAEYVGDLLESAEMDVYTDPDDDPGVLASFEQLIWLANLPVTAREQSRCIARFYAREIYEALDEVNLKALIPVDRWDLVMTGGAR